MPTIIIRRDGKHTEEVVLDKGFTLIGKSASADIRIDDADGIEEHASIAQVGENYVLKDLAGSAGIEVNGQAIKKRVLNDRDLITIGEYRMTFHDKREGDKPGGIEMEAAQSLEQSELAKRPVKFVDPFRAEPNSKSKIVTFVVLGVVLAGIFFASYQSYSDRKAADAKAADENAAMATKSGDEAKRKEAERLQETARAIESSIKR